MAPIPESKTKETNNNRTIILAGATGKLGQRIAYHLLQKGAMVKALVRPGSAGPDVEQLRQQGAVIIEVNYTDTQQLRKACNGGHCVVSALSGLRDVIVDTQTRLLH